MENFLHPEQKSHFNRILDILSKTHVYCDASDPGTGKSELAHFVAKTLNLSLLAIIPADTEVDYRNNAAKYNVDVFDIISYEKLRGDKRYGCNHDLLTRDGDEYQATPKLLAAINKGLLIVFDEYQRARNSEKLTQKACITISKHVMDTKSKIGALSASPIASLEQGIGMVRLLGYVRQTVVLENKVILNRKIPEGSIEHIDVVHEVLGCAKTIITTTNMDISNIKLPVLVNETNKAKFVHNILTNIILPTIRCRMTAVHDVECVIQNKFYNIAPADHSAMIAASSKLKRSIGICRYNRNKNGILDANNVYDKTTELIRVNVIVNEVKKELIADKSCKCLVFLYYYESIDKFKTLMEEYSDQLAVYNGKVSMHDRIIIKSAFQQDNNNLRVLVLNPTVGGTGKSFDDIYGDHLRKVYIAPSSRFIDIYQSCFRTSRVTTASDCNTYMVYANNVPYEKERMNKIIDKLKTMESVIGNTVNFPRTITLETE